MGDGEAGNLSGIPSLFSRRRRRNVQNPFRVSEVEMKETEMAVAVEIEKEKPKKK